MNWLPILACVLVGFGIVVLLVPLILKLPSRFGASRSREFHHTHAAPVSRFGGLALVGAFLTCEAVLGFLFPAQRAQVPGRGAVILSSLAMFAVGFWDDVRPIGARTKLGLQVVIALGVCCCGIGIEHFKLPFTDQMIELRFWGTALTIMWLVGITNLINLVDGMDGLAAGIALMLMGLLLYVSLQSGTFVLLTAGMAGALAAFLCFNRPPARIYLGDGGAYLLGYQIGIFSLVGSNKGSVFTVLVALLVSLAYPIIEILLTLLRRGLVGLPLFRADRGHIHHRLLERGLSERAVLVWLCGLSLPCVLMGFAVCWSQGEVAPALAGGVVLVLLLSAGRLGVSREWLAVGRRVGNALALRQDVRYARAVANLLLEEARRCRSLEEFFAEFTSAGHRLGFTRIQVRLGDSVRHWHDGPGCAGMDSFRQDFADGQRGLVELHGPACLPLHECAAGPDAAQAEHACDWSSKTHSRRFRIIAELLAETWLKAIATAKRGSGPVRFDSPLGRSNGYVHRFTFRENIKNL